MGKYIELKKDNFDSVVKNGVSMVDFWAPWCGPCRMLAPIIDELAAEYAGKANICKVNTDEEEELGAKFGIRSIPSMLFFVNGELKDTIVGATSKQVIQDKINSLL
ncbi:thioredoxin [Helicobacter sp. 13S00401-1]|uniref:thioredoxin n=1 Tax=unclassified Helicobacter TaxID=2593540 RepID=UPI000BA564DF|nr:MULTISPECIES: thioredoxin [unclassified Helicobacter]PAF45276.1 thioredoxin [Helicobacter sp. 11S02629-2]PAF50783.1 thioredoxin [Helicobacter sp. 13S00401-1]